MVGPRRTEQVGLVPVEGYLVIPPRAANALARGIQELKSFACDHVSMRPDYTKEGKECKDAPERGALCNSCYARGLAQDFERLLKEDEGA